MLRATVIVALGVALTVGAASRAPRFEDFRVTEVFKGKPPNIDLRTVMQKRYPTQIRKQAILPANFAGHFRIAEWGCGTSCGMLAVIDLKTGKVYDGPFQDMDYGEQYRYEGGSQDLEYRVSSSLLVARGCPEFKNCGTYYYEWKGDKFDLLRFVPHGPLL